MRSRDALLWGVLAAVLLVPSARAQEKTGSTKDPAAVQDPADRPMTRAEWKAQRQEDLQRIEALERELREIKQRLAQEPPPSAPPETAAETGAKEPTETQQAAAQAGPAEGTPPAAGAWKVGYHEGGGGFYAESPDGDYAMRSLGYVQATAGVYHDDFERTDAPGDFGLRRARLDWIVDYKKKHRLFVEFDGGPGSTPGTSDFALVVAELDYSLEGDDLVVSAGKFVSPFSTENRLSSRSLDTVERYIALNSMFLLPALDVQYGAMVSGKVAANRLEYYLGVFNGNGRANDNLSDDNGDKEIQAKLNYFPRDGARFGLGFDWSNEERQSLQLRGLSFTPWVAVPIEGTRRGVTADFGWSLGRLHLRGEGLAYDFADAGASLGGGFVQGAWALRGDRSNGEEILLRLETAAIGSDRVTLDGDRIDAATLGLNLFRLGVIRWQIDLVAEHYNGLSNLPANQSRVEGDGWKPYLLTELQLKF